MVQRSVFAGLLLLTLTCSAFAEDASEDGSANGVKDPWQGMNRKIQAFNDTADRWVLKPVAKGYEKVVPHLLRRGITNFFTNLTYPLVAVNQFLQGKFAEGASDTGRFIMNTTLGIGGLFDPASGAHLALHDEDFGQTFGKWGVGSGPYLVIPFLGPSTVRDGVGSAVGYVANPAYYYIEDQNTRYGLTALNAIQIRAGLLDAEQLISGDRYIFMRDAYLQRRDYLIKDGQVTDEFLDEDWNE
jgi:phospholipid-binding lipoprotein MlaA